MAQPLFPSFRLPSIALLTSKFSWLKSAFAAVNFTFALFAPDGTFLALYEATEGSARPVAVFVDGSGQ